MNKNIPRVEVSPYSDVEWQAFVESVFKAANMPEVEVDKLEAGTYTNAQIAQKLKANPERLFSLLAQVTNMGSPAEKRSVLSFAVDML